MLRSLITKVTRCCPILIALSLIAAVAILLAGAPNQPTMFNAGSQGDVSGAMALSDQFGLETLAATRKSPTIPIVEEDSPVANVQLSDLMYGQQVRVNDGARYYESADFSGSGKHGAVGNRYTEITRIAGFATVDAGTGRLVEAEAYTRDAVPVGQMAPVFVSTCRPETLWVALCTDGYNTGDVGWVSIFELNWQDGALEISPEAESSLNTIEDAGELLCNPFIRIFYILDGGYAVDFDKFRDFDIHYDPYERHIWASGGILSMGGDHMYWPVRQCTPCSDDEAVKYINDWLANEATYRFVDPETADEIWVWADYDPYIDELYGGILSRPFHGKLDVLVIVTDTHARRLDGLHSYNVFDKVIILDVGPEYEVDSDFAAQISAAYGPVSGITKQDIYDYSLEEYLEAFS